MFRVLPRDEILLESEGDGGLPRPAEAGEPDGAAAEPAAHDLSPLRPGDGVLLRVHVGRHCGALEAGESLNIVVSHWPFFYAANRLLFREMLKARKVQGRHVKNHSTIPHFLFPFELKFTLMLFMKQTEL